MHPGGAGDAPKEEPLKKNQEKKNHEEDLRFHASASNERDAFKFETAEDKPVTERQITYLCDLYIHFTGDEAPTAQVETWRSYTASQANATIQAWNRTVPRYSEYNGPASGDPAYNRLSTNGQDAADRGLIPDPCIGGDAA